MNDELDLQTSHLEALGVEWSPTGLEITADLDYDDAESIAVVLSATVDAGKWGLADLIEWAERRWGEKRYSQLAAATGRSPGGLMNICSVAKRVPREIRRRELSFGHHEEVARLTIPGTNTPDCAAQAAWLQQAVDMRLSRDELRAQIQASRPDLTRRVRSEAASQVIDSKPRVLAPPEGRMRRLEEVAREILDTPVNLDGEACLSADVLERLRAALEATG